MSNIAIATIISLPLLCSSVHAQLTERVSVSSTGSQANDHGQAPVLTPDGRFVAFYGRGSNLVTGDTNGAHDVFLRDRQTGSTQRVSVASNGAEADFDSANPAVSADGRFIAFNSNATNLVAGDTNLTTDVFVRDVFTATTQRVSVGSTGTQSNNHSGEVSLSSNGRYVAFDSDASNLILGDTNGFPDIFVHDRQTGSTVRASVSSAQLEANEESYLPSISEDGRYVAFSSLATNLVPGDTNAITDIFVRDLQLGTTERVSVNTAGVQSNGDCDFAAISAEGDYVAFMSEGNNLTAGDTNGFLDIFLRHRPSGVTQRVTLGLGGLQTDGDSYLPSISRQGSFVVFSSLADNIVAADTNGFSDIFVWDRQNGVTARASISSTGAQGNGGSYSGTITSDGRYVAFDGDSSNLVVADTNGASDSFLNDRSPSAPAVFCIGDGTFGAACPCLNYSGAGHYEGCLSSLGYGGKIVALGAASIAADSLVLSGYQLPNGSCLYFQGTAQVASGLGSAFGDGLRCAGGTITRLGTKTNVGGSSQYPAAGDQSVSVRGLVAAPGVRTYQCWYRNAAAFCTPSTFNLTNGLSVTWGL